MVWRAGVVEEFYSRVQHVLLVRANEWKPVCTALRSSENDRRQTAVAVAVVTSTGWKFGFSCAAKGRESRTRRRHSRLWSRPDGLGTDGKSQNSTATRWVVLMMTWCRRRYVRTRLRARGGKRTRQRRRTRRVTPTRNLNDHCAICRPFAGNCNARGDRCAGGRAGDVRPSGGRPWKGRGGGAQEMPAPHPLPLELVTSRPPPSTTRFYVCHPFYFFAVGFPRAMIIVYLLRRTIRRRRFLNRHWRDGGRRIFFFSFSKPTAWFTYAQNIHCSHAHAL